MDKEEGWREAPGGVEEPGEAPDTDWEAEDDAPAQEWTDPNLAYIHRTILEAMPVLGTEPA